MRYSLVTLDTPAGPRGALRTEGLDAPLDTAAQVLGLHDLPGQLIDVVAGWDDHQASLDRIAQALAAGELTGLDAGSVPVLTPLRYPRKLLCAGANYPRHLDEMGVSYAKQEGERPFFFLKPPSTTLVGPGPTSPMPAGCAMLDWEVELAVVIGRGGRAIAVSDAMDHVAGYAIAVDLSARDLLSRPDSIFKFDFLAGKSQDGSCPLGPALVPARFVPDPQAIDLRLLVNGVPKQSASTREMIFSIAEQIAGASWYVTLEAGDILLTGTPHGVGFPRGDRLEVGDVVTAQADGVGELVFEITAPQPRATAAVG